MSRVSYHHSIYSNWQAMKQLRDSNTLDFKALEYRYILEFQAAGSLVWAIRQPILDAVKVILTEWPQLASLAIKVGNEYATTIPEMRLW